MSDWKEKFLNIARKTGSATYGVAPDALALVIGVLGIVESFLLPTSLHQKFVWICIFGGLAVVIVLLRLAQTYQRIGVEKKREDESVQREKEHQTEQANLGNRLAEMSAKLGRFDPGYKLIASAYGLAAELEIFAASIIGLGSVLGRRSPQFAGASAISKWSSQITIMADYWDSDLFDLNVNRYKSIFTDRVAKLMRELRDKGYQPNHEDSYYLEPNARWGAPNEAWKSMAKELRQAASQISRSLD